MFDALPDRAIGQLFTAARSHNGWRDTPVDEAVLRAAVELAAWGPTSANCAPGRFLLLRTSEAKERLARSVTSANRTKVLTAPVCIVVAHDQAFVQALPRLFPHKPEASGWFADPAVRAETAFRNGTLQGAYLMLALRALGLDCGPMSGFDRRSVDLDFFAGTTWTSNFLCSVGEGEPAALFPRLPRLPFEETCRVL